MKKESYARMDRFVVSCSCLLLLTLSCFHGAKADPVLQESHDAQLRAVGATACFVSLVGRGVGAPLNTCPQGMEQSGLLCYPPCPHNYHALGPVCVQSCSSGFKDLGALCMHTYGKGCCCTVFGCCGCPAGYKDDGCFCRQSYAKKSSGRGVGVSLGCGPGKERNGALCYAPCSYGYHGEGPVCWQNQSTTAQFPIKCNDFVWGVDEGTCRKVRVALSAATVASASCVGVALGATAVAALEPLAVAVCSSSIGEATAAADKIVQLTGARTCPRR